MRLRLHRFRLRIERLKFVKPDLGLNGKLKLPNIRWKKRPSSKRKPHGDLYEDAMSPEVPNDNPSPAAQGERIYHELEPQEDCDIVEELDPAELQQQRPQQVIRPQELALQRRPPSSGYTEVDIVPDELRTTTLQVDPGEYHVLGSNTFPRLNTDAAGPVRAYDHVVLSPQSSANRTLPAAARDYPSGEKCKFPTAGNEYDVSSIAVEVTRMHVISEEYDKLGKVKVTAPEEAKDIE